MIAYSVRFRSPIRRRGWPVAAPILIAIALVAAIWGSTSGRMSFLPSSGPFPATPRIGIDVTSPEQVTGRPIGGLVTITVADAARLTSPVRIEVYPLNAPQTAAARVRVISLDVPGPELAAGQRTSVSFTWDQRDDSGRQVPAGSYAITARVSARADDGDKHVGATSVTGVNVRIGE